jgi:hypothetical protein
LKGTVENSNSSEDDKIRVLHDALVQRIEDTKNLDDHKATTLRRLEDAKKERDRCKAETQRALQAKTKLEGTLKVGKKK